MDNRKRASRPDRLSEASRALARRRGIRGSEAEILRALRRQEAALAFPTRYPALARIRARNWGAYTRL